MPARGAVGPAAHGPAGSGGETTPRTHGDGPPRPRADREVRATSHSRPARSDGATGAPDVAEAAAAGRRDLDPADTASGGRAAGADATGPGGAVADGRSPRSRERARAVPSLIADTIGSGGEF